MNLTKSVTVSSLSEIRKTVSTLICEIKRSVSLSVECEYHIQISLRELLANSLCYSGTQQATLLYRLSKEGLRCCVIDGGNGFNYFDRISTCPCIANERGRGVFLVHQIAKEMRYNKKGNMVFFVIEVPC